MQIRIFNIPLTDSGENQSELNRFLAGNKVLEIEQRFFQNEKGGFWTFCVRYLTSGNPLSFSKEKVDYKQVLSISEFAVFSLFREVRKQLSLQEGVPAYAIFTDEELAGISRLEELSEKQLVKIKGIGEKKVAKYGKIAIEMYHQKKQTPHEA